MPSVTQVRPLSYKRIISWYSGLVKAKPPEAPFKHVVQIGDPTLRTVSDVIPRDLIKLPEIKFLINRMKNVMKNHNSVGLSAPQVGVPLQLFLVECNAKHLNEYSPQEQKVKEMKVVPFKVVINPQIKITDYTKLTFVESCASVKGFHAEVPRYKSLKLEAFDEENQKFEMELTGWPARIVQHEVDHLNGKIYTDIMDRKSLACSCWQEINERGGKIELPYGPQ
ncbi:peptide deformylase, mitochondrial [Tribolium castaneum]|uniref:Peptide deformylase n=1 Tax=Tribolium castaneum TaxID=7070 RepID=D6X4P8_TRICA|nr:PREDICTED: peptide deformylase, mitochondrial [Tribolium castaneum]EEZ97665.1 Peptide deformylase, mitochondrial-like Protein [Tribolium castaneum]|eukprot:XP_967363.1 PREDICTED: peptide deformylase, mitochondrial [Tribolium castaneum]